MEIVTRADRPELQEAAAVVFRERWPEFIFHDDVPNRYMGRVKEYFARYDVMVLDEGSVIAGGWAVPIAWDGTIDDLPSGYDDALIRAVQGREAGIEPTSLSFMAIAVGASHDKRGMAGVVLEELTRRAHIDGLAHVVAPLQPTWKHWYPMVSMAEYAGWARPDGLSIDPWIRTHQRWGARVLGPAPRSMVIEGSVAEWESWADMVFPRRDSPAIVTLGTLLRGLVRGRVRARADESAEVPTIRGTRAKDSTTAQSAIAVNGGSFTATVPGRSLVTYVVRGGNLPPVPTRYEAEDPPATCDGTIDSNHSGYSGTGFCNTTTTPARRSSSQ